MIGFNITDDNGNIKMYELVSYDINKQVGSVVLKLNSSNFSVSYELRPDERFTTIDNIENYLNELFDKAIALGCTLNVSEYFARMYLMIGYETDEEYVSGQFTASKL